jgi:hypothetical protein
MRRKPAGMADFPVFGEAAEPHTLLRELFFAL